MDKRFGNLSHADRGGALVQAAREALSTDGGYSPMTFTRTRFFL
jgi:hypothetical protein